MEVQNVKPENGENSLPMAHVLAKSTIHQYAITTVNYTCLIFLWLVATGSVVARGKNVMNGIMGMTLRKVQFFLKG